MSEQREFRVQKIDELREAGFAPWPDRFHRTHSTAEARELPEGTEGVAVAGRLRLIRHMGKLAFAHLQDQSGQIQIMVRKNAVGDETFKALKKLTDIGDFLGVRGTMIVTKTGEVTVEAAELTFLGKALRPLPEKWHGLADQELCYRQRYLDLVMNDETRERFLLRSRVVSAIRRLLDREHELEVLVLAQVHGGLAAKDHFHRRSVLPGHRCRGTSGQERHLGGLERSLTNDLQVLERQQRVVLQ